MNSIASDTVSGSQAHEPRCWSCKPTQPQLVGVMQQEPCAFSRSGSLCSSQVCLIAVGLKQHQQRLSHGSARHHLALGIFSSVLALPFIHCER